MLSTTLLARGGRGPSASTFTLRPGLYRDVPSFAHAYYSSFSDTRPGASDDNLLEVLFGAQYRDHPRDMHAVLAAMLAPRLWSLEYRMAALVEDATDRVVGFVCYKRPKTEVSFYERWISPRTWLNRIYTAAYTISLLFARPGGALDMTQAAGFGRAMVDLEPRVRCTPRRRAAWYLSIVAVEPEYQGLGLGGGMLHAVLDHAEEVGAVQSLRDDEEEGGEEPDLVGGPAMWLTARKGTEGLYRKHGFVKVMESSIGPLSLWNGGAVMFRGLKGVEDLP